MTVLTPTGLDARSTRARPRATFRRVTARRVIGIALIVVPLGWALLRATHDGDIVNRGGLALIDDLLASALHPKPSLSNQRARTVRIVAPCRCQPRRRLEFLWHSTCSCETSLKTT